MAITLNTIPAQTGEVVRALITSGLGGDNTVNRIWLDTRTATASGSFVGDLEIASTLPGSLTRVLWHTTGQLRLIFVSGGILAATADGGALFGKHVLLSFNDTDPAFDVDLDIAAADGTLDKQLRWNASAAEEALYDAVALGSLINLVISDAPGAVTEVFVDTAAVLTAGAPTITAVADKEVPAPTFDTAATLTAGAPTLAASAEKVGLVQEFHDTSAVVTAGAPSAAAAAEVVEGGIFEVAVPLVAGTPSVVAVAASVGLAQPFHDRAAALTAGPASVAVVAARVGLANEFHDTAAVIEAGPPSLSALVELDEAGVIEVLVSLVAGAPQVEAEAGAVALATAFTDTTVSLTAGAPSFSVAGVEKRVPSDRTGPIARSITQGVATIKSTLLAGGLLRAVEWHRPTGERDVRGRQDVLVSLLDVLIEQRPALERTGGFTTDRNDNTVLTILDPVAITDEDTFRWGDHTYKVKAIDGVVANAATGIRFSSEVTVIR